MNELVLAVCLEGHICCSLYIPQRGRMYQQSIKLRERCLRQEYD